MEDLEKLAQAIKQKDLADVEIARIIGRPAERGHTGEYIAARIFSIDLQHSATHKGSDGRFSGGDLAGKAVNVKWYGKMEGLLDVNLDSPPDFYLVMTGPKAAAVSSRGTTRPWVISHVYLFDAQRLATELRGLGVKVGIATSVRSHLWDAAEIYPNQRNRQLLLSYKQKTLLALFG